MTGTRKGMGLLLVFALLISLIGIAVGPLAAVDTAGAQGTTVEVEGATLLVGGSGSVDIWVRNFPDDGFGLGAYTLNVFYDPLAVEITGVSDGDDPFDGPIWNIFGVTGRVSITQFSTQLPGPTGDIRIADLELTCLAAGDTLLEVEVVTLSNTNGIQVAADEVDGQIVQVAAIAETGVKVQQCPSDDVVIVTTWVERVKDPTTGGTITGVPVADYVARALYDPDGIQMLGVRPGDAPFGAPVPNIDNPSGVTGFAQDTVAGAEPPIVVARLVPRLVGCATETYDLQVTFDLIADAEGTAMQEETPQILSFQRGDVNGDTLVNIIDAMMGAQYVVGGRPVEQIRPLNMASVLHDDNGDLKTITDCMFIAHYVVQIRDCYFELLDQ